MLLRQKIDISSSTIFRVILILIGFWLVYLIWDVLLMLFAAGVVAAAIEPLADWGQRYRAPRAVSVAVVYAAVLLVLFGVATLMIDPLSHQLRQLAQAIPGLVAWLDEALSVVGGVDQAHVTSLQQGLSRVGDNLGSLTVNFYRGAGTFFARLVMVVFVFVVAFYLVVEEGALKKFIRFVVPADHWPFASRVIDRAHAGVGRWLLAQLTLGIIVGGMVGGGLWLLNVPYALLLGLLAGVLEFIPVLGPIIAAVPAVIIGLSQSLVSGAAVLGFYLVVQQVENNVLVPHIMRRAIGLHPLVTILAVLLGARLVGVAGAILAVPLASVASIILTDILRGEHEEELAG